MILMTYHVYIIHIHHSPLGSLRCAGRAFILEHPRAVPCQALAVAKLQFRIHLIVYVRVAGNMAAF